MVKKKEVKVRWGYYCVTFVCNKRVACWGIECGSSSQAEGRCDGEMGEVSITFLTLMKLQPYDVKFHKHVETTHLGVKRERTSEGFYMYAVNLESSVQTT